jgi:hypothetical protein
MKIKITNTYAFWELFVEDPSYVMKHWFIENCPVKSQWRIFQAPPSKSYEQNETLDICLQGETIGSIKKVFATLDTFCKLLTNASGDKNYFHYTYYIESKMVDDSYLRVSIKHKF